MLGPVTIVLLMDFAISSKRQPNTGDVDILENILNNIMFIFNFINNFNKY